MAYAGLALRLLLAAVCLVAVVGKLRQRAGFTRMLTDVGVPPRLAPATGAAVVGAESAIAALAPWRPTAVAGSLLAAGLFTLLAAGVARAVSRGSPAACRCFGGRGRRLRWDHVVRNAALAGVAGAAAVIAAADPPGTHPVGWASAAAAAALGTLVVVFWDDLVGTAAPVPSRKG